MKRWFIDWSEPGIGGKEFRLFDLPFIGVFDAAFAVAGSSAGSEYPALYGDIFIGIFAARFEQPGESVGGFQQFGESAHNWKQMQLRQFGSTAYIAWYATSYEESSLMAGFRAPHPTKPDN